MVSVDRRATHVLIVNAKPRLGVNYIRPDESGLVEGSRILSLIGTTAYFGGLCSTIIGWSLALKVRQVCEFPY